MKTVVSLIKSNNVLYPVGDCNPPVRYPELNKLGYVKETNRKNKVYTLVRESFVKLGLDSSNLGEENWNPLKSLVSRGQSVVIKPNLVYDKHPLGDEGVLSMITNASIIRPIIDYILLATDFDVDITICDVPLQTADWERLVKKGGYKQLISFYKKKGIKINLLDLRKEIALKDEEGFIYKRVQAKGDPLGYTAVNLGKKSYLQEIIQDYKRLEITDYNSGTVSKHHNPKKNEYLIPNTILKSDVFINVPKLKTHKKAGITCAMKNLIGINGDKSWIAHHRRGVDEFPKLNLWSYLKWHFAHNLKRFAPNFVKKFIFKFYKRVFLRGKTMSLNNMEGGGTLMEGNWYGNDTLWRTILDLNNILFFSDKNGDMQESQQRKYLVVVDGLVGMEKEGPMEGIPKQSGVVIAGSHPVVVDYLAAFVMGFNYRKIPQISKGFQERFFNLSPFSLDDISVQSNLNWKQLNLRFKPPKGWKNYIENE